MVIMGVMEVYHHKDLNGSVQMVDWRQKMHMLMQLCKEDVRIIYRTLGLKYLVVQLILLKEMKKKYLMYYQI